MADKRFRQLIDTQSEASCRFFQPDGRRPVIALQLLKTGTFARFGEPIKITPELFGDFIRNFDARVRKIDLALDAEHMDDEGALGWFVDGTMRTESDGSELWVDVELNPDGEKQVKDKIRRYVSIEFDPGYIDNETGEIHGPTALGAALTNRPFIKGMKPATLNYSEFAAEFRDDQEPAESGVSPEERAMTEEQMKALAKILGLSEDATPEQIEAAVTGLSQQKTETETQVAALQTQLTEATTKLSDATKRADTGNETVSKLTEQVNALSTRLDATNKELSDEKARKAIDAAKRAGKLTEGELKPDADGTESYYKYLAFSDLPAFERLMAKTQVKVNMSNGGTAGGEETEADAATVIKQFNEAVAKIQAERKVELGDAQVAVELEQPELFKAFSEHRYARVGRV